MNKLNLITIAVLINTLTACSTNPTKSFGCPGMPSGIICKTPTEVYNMNSDNKESTVAFSGDIENNDLSKQKTEELSSELSVLQKNMKIITSPSTLKLESGPVPILEQPRVLRIWVAPWTDENDTLNWPTYMFTQINTKTWKFGQASFRNDKIPAPMVSNFASKPKENIENQNPTDNTQNLPDTNQTDLNQQQNNVVAPSLQSLNQ